MKTQIMTHMKNGVEFPNIPVTSTLQGLLNNFRVTVTGIITMGIYMGM